MRNTSSSRWVTKTTETPSAFSRLTISNRLATSVSDSAEVGSSITISRERIDSARAISTSCCSATESSRTGVSGSRLRPMRSEMARVSAASLRQLTNSLEPGSRPMNTFSAIDMSGASVNSW